MGLAWTQMGGATLFVEAQGRVLPNLDNPDSSDSDSDSESTEPEKKTSRPAVPSTTRHGQFRVTGQLGGVMNESCQIAMSFAKHFISEFEPKNRYLDEVCFHIFNQMSQIAVSSNLQNSFMMNMYRIKVVPTSFRVKFIFTFLKVPHPRMVLLLERRWPLR